MRALLLIVSVGLILPSFGSGPAAATDAVTSLEVSRSGGVQPATLAHTDFGPNDTSAGTGEGMSPELLALRIRLRRCLAHYVQRPCISTRLCPWEVMHCTVGFGVDTQLMYGGKHYNAVAWLCENLPCQGMRMLYTEDGKLRVRSGEFFQGHAGQFLAILAQSRINNGYPLIVDDQQFTVADLIEYEKQSCRSQTELSFQLIGLSHYLDTDATWKNDLGEDWDMPRLIREELAQSVVGASCGGTHRMMAFSYAVRKRAASGMPMTGQWHRADVYIRDFHKYTFAMQNPDGSFSTSWFRGRQDSSNIDRKLTTTGHMLEWLIHSMPEEDLAEPATVNAVSFLTDLLWENRHRDWEIGPLGHGLHSLTMFDRRVFDGKPGQRPQQLAMRSVHRRHRSER